VQYSSLKKCLVTGSSKPVEWPENPDKSRIKPSNQRQANAETRYYINDDEGFSAVYYKSLARGRWDIENHLHWHLDITFKENNSRARKDNAPENLSTMRKLACKLSGNNPMT
jgi:predicted transposase YbfD/YdcC